MFKLWKLVTLFALIATPPSKIQASATDQYDQDQDQAFLGLAPETLNDHTLSPSLYVDDALSLETQGLYDEEGMAPEYQYPSPAYAPEIDEDEYPYADNPSVPPSPSPAPYTDDLALAPELEDDGDEVLYSPSPSEAPTPSPTEFNSGVSDYDIAPQVEGTGADAHAHAPVLPFNYSAEDDGEFSDDYDDEDYPEDEKKMNGTAIGYFVVGAVCVVGLGGLACKKRKDEKRKQYQMYELARKGEF